jgi:hypothetical protein
MSRKQVQKLEEKVINLAVQNAALNAREIARQEADAARASAAQAAAAAPPPPPPAPPPPPPKTRREELAELRSANPYAASVFARIHAREILAESTTVPQETRPGRSVI